MPELLETILTTFQADNEKELARQIVKRFLDSGLPVKVKQYHQACMNGTYRILCFIKKSAEAVIINNKGMGRDGVSFQVRISDRDTLEKLDSFSENVKRQILNADDYGYCSSKREGKKYIFTYRGIYNPYGIRIVTESVMAGFPSGKYREKEAIVLVWTIVSFCKSCCGAE